MNKLIVAALVVLAAVGQVSLATAQTSGRPRRRARRARRSAESPAVCPGGSPSTKHAGHAGLDRAPGAAPARQCRVAYWYPAQLSSTDEWGDTVTWVGYEPHTPATDNREFRPPPRRISASVPRVSERDDVARGDPGGRGRAPRSPREAPPRHGKLDGRPLHRKTLAALHARFEVGEAPRDLRHGLFAEPGSYDAFARFSSGAGQARNDRVADVRGLAVKVLGVTGPEGDPRPRDGVHAGLPHDPLAHLPVQGSGRLRGHRGGVGAGESSQ